MSNKEEKTLTKKINKKNLTNWIKEAKSIFM